MTSGKLDISVPSPGIVVLTLNRPEVMNAIDMDLAGQLFDELAKAERDDAMRCIVITGAGDRAFSAGFDIAELAKFDGQAMLDAFEFRDPLMLAIVQHRLPVIAALNGLAYGAGALIAAAADIRLAAPAAPFKVTAVGYGGANATWSLPRLVGPGRAKEILMTGRKVEAAEALSIGLYDRIVDDEPVVAAAIKLAAQIAKNPAEAVNGIKKLVDASLALDPSAGWRAEYEHMTSSLMANAKSGGAVFEKFLGDHDRRPTA